MTFFSGSFLTGSFCIGGPGLNWLRTPSSIGIPLPINVYKDFASILVEVQECLQLGMELLCIAFQGFNLFPVSWLEKPFSHDGFHELVKSLGLPEILVVSLKDALYLCLNPAAVKMQNLPVLLHPDFLNVMHAYLGPDDMVGIVG